MSDQLLLWKGVQLCIALQLTIIGVLNIISRKNDKLISGIICLVLSSYFYKTVFWTQVHDNNFLIFFLSGSLFFFFGQLLYLYLETFEKKSIFKFIIWHLPIPFILFLGYGIIRSFYKEIFVANFLAINIAAISICLLSVIIYFYLGIIKFRTVLDHSLKFKAKQKYKLFYYTMNIFLIYHFVLGISLLIADTFTNKMFFKFIDPNIYYVDYIHNAFFLVLGIYLFLYVLTQSKSYKTYFIGEKFHIHNDIIEGKPIIEKRIVQHFDEDKIFLNTELKLADAALKIGVSSDVFSQYLKSSNQTSFKNFVNSYRIDEFKTLLKHVKSTNYSIWGLAQQAGFKSKATFYRAFKYQENTTPNEYLKTLEVTSLSTS